MMEMLDILERITDNEYLCLIVGLGLFGVSTGIVIASVKKMK